MSEEQIQNLTQKLRKAGIEDGVVSTPEVITTKNPTVLPAVKSVNRRSEKLEREQARKLRDAKKSLKKIATDLGKERARLQEIYALKEKYYLTEDENNISKQLTTELFKILQNRDFDRAKLAEAASILLRLDQAQKLRNTLDLEIENRRLAIEKLKKQVSENEVAKENTFTFNIKTPLTRLRQRFSLKKIAKQLKKETDSRIDKNEKSINVIDNQLKSAFIEEKDLQNVFESISEKNIQQLTQELGLASSEYDQISAEADAYAHEHHHYTEELLKRKREAWDKYATALWATIVKQQELERKKHYQELKDVFAKYGVEQKANGTIFCKVGDDIFEVRKHNKLADAEKVLAAAKEYEAAKENTENVEELADNKIDSTDFSLPKEEPEITPITEPQLMETPDKENDNSDFNNMPTVELKEEALTPVNTEEKTEENTSLVDELNNIENEYKAAEKASVKDLLSQRMKLVNARRIEIEKQLDAAQKQNERIKEIRTKQLNELYGEPASRGSVFEQGEEHGQHRNAMQDYDNKFLVPVTVIDKDGKEDILYPVARTEINSLKDERNRLVQEYNDLEAERKQKFIETNREKAEQKKQADLLKRAKEFFKYVDTSTTVGYNIDGLTDDQVIDLYQTISRNKSNSVYKKAIDTMNEERKNGISREEKAVKEEPVKIPEQKTDETPKYEPFYNVEEEIDKEMNEQINSAGNISANSSYERVIEMLADNYKQQGLSKEAAELEAVTQFTKNHPGQPLPKRYEKYQNMEKPNVDTSGLDVYVSDNGYSVDPTEDINVSHIRR